MPPNQPRSIPSRVFTGNWPEYPAAVDGGYATYYRFLAQELPQHPIVGTQPKGLQGETPLRTFEELGLPNNGVIIIGGA